MIKTKPLSIDANIYQLAAAEVNLQTITKENIAQSHNSEASAFRIQEQISARGGIYH